MDQVGSEGFRDISRGCQVHVSRGPHDRCREPEGRHCKADAGLRVPFRGDAFRLVYAVQVAEEIWVVHTFRKKSTRGIKTPQPEIDLIKQRLNRLREMLR